MKAGGLFVALLFSSAGTAALSGPAKPSMFGPVHNAEDQFRYIDGNDLAWGRKLERPMYYDDMRRIGFNTHFITLEEKFYDVGSDCVPTNVVVEDEVKWRNAYLDRCLRDGIGVFQHDYFAANRELIERFPRVMRNGKPNFRNLDASNPEAGEILCRAATALGEVCRHPAVIGYQDQSEIRDNGHPSFTPEMRAAYRAHSGHDVPIEVVTNSASARGREPPHWNTLKGFPADRIVDDDCPVLDFYVWTWRKGDGWNDLLTRIAKAAKKAAGKDILTLFDPSLRHPALMDMGGEQDILSHWTYGCPEPYNVNFNISQQRTRARGQQGVFVTLQAICYRSRSAPVGEHPEDEPGWTRIYPRATYITMPADILREQLWVTLSRKVDGYGFHHWTTLWDPCDRYDVPYFRRSNAGYRCTTPEAREAIGEVMRDAGIPLGPLLRAIPERKPELAIVESYASQILGSRISWDCAGRAFDIGTAATAANLAPASLLEDGIRETGIPESVKVLLMPACDVLTRKCYEKIAAFQRRGGLIVGDKWLCPALTADAQLPWLKDAYPKTVDDHDTGKAPIASAEIRERSMRAAAADLRKKVAAKVVPYADADRPDILVSVRTYKTSDYVFAINDRRGFGDYVGPWKRLKEKGLPNAGTIVVNREAGAVYDLVRHEPVAFDVREGKTYVKVGYERTDGRILMFVPQALEPLAVKVSGTSVTVTTSDRSVLVPIRVTGCGERPYYAVVRDGVWSHDFGRMPQEEVCVTNLADGRLATIK